MSVYNRTITVKVTGEDEVSTVIRVSESELDLLKQIAEKLANNAELYGSKFAPTFEIFE